jgi:sugar phosphate isomerase/epimerase
MLRREFIASGVFALASGQKGLQVGGMDGILGLAVKPEALDVAARVGLAGVQLTIGKPDASGKLPLSDAALQDRFLAESKSKKVALTSTYLDVLHVNCLKNDALAKKWVREGIEINRRMKIRILMLVFFGKCSIPERAEMAAVATALKELAPEAERAGVVLGFENTISADDDSRVLDEVRSKALKVFYDVGNSTNMGGFDVPAEIRRLGRERICQFHVKDKGYLGEGKVDVGACVKAIHDIRYEGWLILETGAPSKDVEADTRRNAEYLKKLL